MRTLNDRIRHTLLFEFIALIIIAIFGSWITGLPVEMLGALSLMFSVLAMAWNMLYNWLFDLWDMKYRLAAKRGFLIRAIHAVLFELVLLSVGVFLVAWWLSIPLLEALVLDIGLSAFFVVYAFGFNWSYDLVFPVLTEA